MEEIEEQGIIGTLLSILKSKYKKEVTDKNTDNYRLYWLNHNTFYLQYLKNAESSYSCLFKEGKSVKKGILFKGNMEDFLTNPKSWKLSKRNHCLAKVTLEENKGMKKETKIVEDIKPKVMETEDIKLEIYSRLSNKNNSADDFCKLLKALEDFYMFEEVLQQKKAQEVFPVEVCKDNKDDKIEISNTSLILATILFLILLTIAILF